MKKQNNAKPNVIARYSQQVLSGWSHSDKQEDKDSKSTQEGTITWNVTPSFWQQEEYTVLVPVVVKRVVVSDAQHEYEISIPTNVDILISPNRATSKNLLKQVSSLPKTAKRDTAKISLVSRISKEGGDTLSLTPKSDVPGSVAYIYGRLLGVVHRTIERMVLQPEKEERTVDTGRGKEATQGQKGGLGKH